MFSFKVLSEAIIALPPKLPNIPIRAPYPAICCPYLFIASAPCACAAPNIGGGAILTPGTFNPVVAVPKPADPILGEPVNVANSSNCTYSEGGTKVVNGASAYRSFISTIAVTKGKWYAEFNGGNPNDHFGAEVCPVDANDGNMDQSYMSSFTEGIGYYHNGNKYIDNSASSYGNSITNSNLIGCALDMDNGYVYFSKDNTWQNSGDPTSGSSGTGGIALIDGTKPHYMGTSNNNTAASYCNFGGFTALTVSSGNADANGYGNFEHAPPSGYYALCTKNLAKYGG